MPMSRHMRLQGRSTVRTAPVQDSRRNARMAVSLPCEVRSGQLTYKARVVHISLSGAFVASNNQHSAGEPVTIVVPSPQGQGSLTLKGRVTRAGQQRSTGSNYQGFAVRFEQPSADLMLILKEAIARRAPFLRGA